MIAEIDELWRAVVQPPGEIHRRLAQVPPPLRCDERKFGVGVLLVLGSAHVPVRQPPEPLAGMQSSARTPNTTRGIRLGEYARQR